jgi:hypothetical protein
MAVEGISAVASPEKGNDMTELKDLIRTLLYEGYALYPYRGTAPKNKTAIPFGILYPESFCCANPYKKSTMQTHCLFYGDMETSLKISYQFLHLSTPDDDCQSDSIAVEREINTGWIHLQNLLQEKLNIPFCFFHGENDMEPYTLCVEGLISVSAEQVENNGR